MLSSLAKASGELSVGLEMSGELDQQHNSSLRLVSKPPVPVARCFPTGDCRLIPIGQSSSSPQSQNNGYGLIAVTSGLFNPADPWELPFRAWCLNVLTQALFQSFPTIRVRQVLDSVDPVPLFRVLRPITQLKVAMLRHHQAMSALVMFTPGRI